MGTDSSDRLRALVAKIPRDERLIVAAAFVAGVVFVCLAARPGPPPEQVYLKVGAHARAAMTAWTTIEREFAAGGIDRASAAYRVERDVLPEIWAACYGCSDLRQRRVATPDRLDRLLYRRRVAWAEFVAAAKADGPGDDGRKFRDLWSAAEETAAEWRSLSPPPDVGPREGM